MSDNLYIVVTHDAPGDDVSLEPLDAWWRADIVVAGVYGGDKTIVATGFGKRTKDGDATAELAQGSAIAKAWHDLHRSTPIRRP